MTRKYTIHCIYKNLYQVKEQTNTEKIITIEKIHILLLISYPDLFHISCIQLTYHL